MENIASNDYLDSLDDPVTLFDREIRRMLKSPSALHSDLDRQLQSVLRRCIDYIQQQHRYRNDPRYLRIWLMYAFYYRDPLHVLEYLERAEIGRYLSAFYENYASLLERSGRYSITPLEQRSFYSSCGKHSDVFCDASPYRPLDAISVIRTGLSMAAQPIRRLQDRMAALQKKYADQQGACTPNTLHLPEIKPVPDPSLYLTMLDSHKKYRFPVVLNVHDDSVKKCQLIIEAIVFDKQDANCGTSNQRSQQIVRPTKRRHRTYSENLQGGCEQLSFEEVRARKAPCPPRRSPPTANSIPRAKSRGEDCDENTYTEPLVKYGSTSMDHERAHARLAIETGTAFSSSDRFVSQTSAKATRKSMKEQCGRLKRSSDSSYYPLNKQTRRVTEKVRRDFYEVNSAEGMLPVVPTHRKQQEIAVHCASHSISLHNSLTGAAVQLSTDMFNKMTAKLQSSLKDDCDYYAHACELLPLKRGFVRLQQSDPTKFVPFVLQLAPYSLSVISTLAQGGHARVYKAKSLENVTYALKIQWPSYPYEYCILRRLLTVLGPSSSSCIVRPMSYQHFKDASCLVMEYFPQGTLLDAVNKARKHYSRMGATSVQGLVEPLAMFLAVRLLQIVIVLHQNSFVHGDIKADNVMINFQSLVTDKSTKSPFLSYTGHDDNYWELKQLKMIDFGKAVDLSLFPTGQKFVANWPTNVNDDPPQAQGHGEWEPWTLDYWGTAKAIHCLLFGQHMKVIPNANLWSIRNPMKRWWYTQIWNKTFNILLNPGRNLPITSTLIDIQQEMTNILIQRERKNGKRLSNMISELETILNG